MGRWFSCEGRRSGNACSKALSNRRKFSLSVHNGISNGVNRLLIWASLWNATGASLVPTATMQIFNSLARYFRRLSDARCSRWLPASR